MEKPYMIDYTPVTIYQDELELSSVIFLINNEYEQKFMFTDDCAMYRYSNNLKRWILIKTKEQCLELAKIHNKGKFESVYAALEDAEFVAKYLI